MKDMEQALKMKHAEMNKAIASHNENISLLNETFVRHQKVEFFE